MPVQIKHVQALVEMWSRREEPVGPDLRNSIHIARMLEEEPQSPTHLRAFAWQLVNEAHRAVEWQIPADEKLSACCGAATSVSHSAALVKDDVAVKLEGVGGPVVILGAMAASYSLFGRWDVLPASGAALVPLESGADALLTANLHTDRGVRWGAAGRFREVYETNTVEADLAGHRVLVPTPELIAARSSGGNSSATELESLIFCGAARASVEAGTWHEVMALSRSLGHGRAPLEMVLRLGIRESLGLDTKRSDRMMLGIKRLFQRVRPRRAS